MALPIIKALLLLACAGHLLLWRCDWMLTCLDGGRFNFKALQDNTAFSAVIGQTPPSRPLWAAMAGVFGMAVELFGYLALSEWVKPFAPACSALMLVGSVLYAAVGAVHHMLCGMLEWLYIRMGRTEQARRQVLELFQKTSSTMYVCYMGLLLFAVGLLAAVAGGMTTLPRWACLFNVFPLFLVLAPFHLVGTGNIACAIMFLGLFALL